MVSSKSRERSRRLFAVAQSANVELAGHQELGTTQRYMHLSPAARENAIRLLETGTRPKPVGDMLEVAGT
jgi:hypothetical protein